MVGRPNSSAFWLVVDEQEKKNMAVLIHQKLIGTQMLVRRILTNAITSS